MSSTTRSSSGRSPPSRASAGNVIDGILVEGAVHSGPFVARLAGDLFRFTTTGNVRNYLLYFFVGLLVLFWWVVR